MPDYTLRALAMSIEQMPSTTERRTPTSCPACGAPVAVDQRYCLECGERQVARSDFLMAGAAVAPPPPAQPSPPAPVAPDDSRRNTMLVLALIALLLLATGIGVLIGKGGRGPVYKPVIVNAGGGSGSTASSTAPAATETATFTSDWPAAKTGFTVELETLPSSTSPSAVKAAKSAATAKGAPAVGALKAEEFPSIGGSGFVIFSGQYTGKAQAQKALGELKGKFPGAKVIEVSQSEPGETKSEAKESAKEAQVEQSKGTGEALTKPAKAPEKHASGKNYVEESKSLPNVVETP